MPTSVPTLPTPLPGVEVIAEKRRGSPVAVVVGSADGDTAPRIGPGGDELTGDLITAAAPAGTVGEVQPGPVGSTVRWVAGIGDGGPDQWRIAGAALSRAVNASIASDADAGRTVERTMQLELPPDTGLAEIGGLVRGLRLGGYQFKVTETEAKPRLRAIRLIVRQEDRIPDVEAAVRRAAALAEATGLTRDLANTPSNVKDPAWLARTAARVAGRAPGLRITIRDERWLAEHGFGGVLAVGGGSARPPRLIELSWQPRGIAGVHLVLVGKGITFDTGGISVKRGEGVHLMRTDMAGGAAVIAAIMTVARLELDVRVTGLVPCAENHMSGSAYRPGDLVRHYGGRTTEVTNTDAEGRMVLADALAYAADRLRPDVVVDVATLTGAMKTSLGLRIGGLFASDDTLAARVVSAGERAGEAWWRMPLLADLDSLAGELGDAVRSETADVRQCPPGPGGITAALFLQEFTGGLPWAHLDIAGPARAERSYEEVVAGATGFAARTLVELVSSYSPAGATPPSL